MHADICNFNAEALGGMIDRMQAELSRFRESLREPSLERTFVEVAEVRRGWAARKAKTDAVQ